ncbi:3-oxo-5-alpha-steroid 4-dehydrogenase [Macrophomina phaseolina MS6]|uniref:3-oxo-5-alpha-steroid 4-dehydrogenase n=1 Tax=Macrophomina phaseolina (strain MS6) TaxID=1126212 RepID=K2RSV3_MACPH|nr:3-oxo-5-alpha-steroid 4-dehydrogenase [Macrophomina phaseolina MS6]
MPLLPTLLHATAFKTPLLRTLVPTIALAYGIQAAVAVPSIAAQSERFYDASGSITYLACTGVSLVLPVLRARYAAGTLGTNGLLAEVLRGRDWRQLALSAAVSIWAVRLGSFLLKRITAENGQDSRFDSIRVSPPKFLGAFMAQATWVSLCALPVVLLNSLPAGSFAALGPLFLTDVIGLALYVFGIVFEATADRQKSQWMEEKKEKKHEEDFLTRGLWSKSRHPNYFGEITLWSGIAVAASGVVASTAGLSGLGLSAGLVGRLGAASMCAVSPAFVAFLLLKVSGIPLSENKYDKRYGDRKDYQEWKRNTPMLFPKFFG